MWIRDERKITNDFKAYEYQCKGELHSGFLCCGGSMFMQEVTTNFAQKLRNYMERFLVVRSACRCLTYNRSPLTPNSKDTSSHVRGYAIDLAVPKGLTLAKFHDIIMHVAVLEGLQHIIRIGLYDDFIHIDFDPNKTVHFWDNRTTKG